MTRLPLLLLLGAGLLLARPSRADEKATQTPAPSKAPAASSDFNFDLMGDTPKQEPDAETQKRILRIERQSRIRRKFILAHQVLGFATLTALTATVVIGHLNYHDRYVSGEHTDRYQAAHLGLSVATTVAFTGTGLFGVFAPNPYPKPIRFDTAFVHKLSMILATAGMATQIVLGAVAARRDGRLNQPDLALGHVVVGYATWAFMATGVIAYMF